MGTWSCGTPADCHNTEKWLTVAGNEFTSTGEMCPLRAPACTLLLSDLQHVTSIF